MLKSNLLPIVALLAAIPIAAAQAQVVVWKKGQKSIDASLDVQNLEQPKPRYAWDAPRKLQLTPAPEPTPALKYRFWVPPVENRPGDVRTHLDRVIMMSLQDDNRQSLSTEYAELSSKFFDESDQRINPPEEVLQQVRLHLEKQADVLDQLHYALSLDTIRSDYALRDMRGADFHNYILANIQHLRQLARLLQLECQLAVGQGRYEDAIASLRDGYRVAELAMQSGEGTIVSYLVSIAIAGIMNSEVEFLAQQEGSPNLYWALASLPSEQLFAMRNAFEGEAIGTLQALFPWGTDQATTSELQAETRLLELMEHALSSLDGRPTSAQFRTQQQSLAALAVLFFADRARIEMNEPQLGNCQAVLAWAQSDFVRLRDEVFKWMLLPVQERRAYEDRMDTSMQFMGGGLPDSPGKVLAGLIFPAVQAADAAAQRTQRKHAFLITLEALRAHAAEHNGELPETLDNLHPLPAWLDPTTGQPFNYRRTDPQHAIVITEKSIGLPHEFHIEIVSTSSPGSAW